MYQNGPSIFRIAACLCRPLDAEAIRTLFAASDLARVVYCSTSLPETLSFCQSYNVEAAILDARFPGRGTFSAAASLSANCRNQVVIVLDDDVRMAQLESTLRIARCGYFTRCSTREEIIYGIRRLLNGQVAVDKRVSPTDVISPKLLLNVIRRIDHHGLIGLSKREREVMHLLASGHSAAQIGEKLGIQVSTVDNHRSRLMKKLNVSKATQLTQIAFRQGYLE